MQRMAAIATSIHRSDARSTSSKLPSLMFRFQHLSETEFSRRLDSLENELQQMRQELGHRQNTPSTSSPSVLGSVPREAVQNLLTPGVEIVETTVPISRGINTELLDSIELSPSVTAKLIEE